MKHPDENPMLNEILTDERLAAVRNASLDRGLAAMRRARRFRQAQRAGLLTFPLVLLVLLWMSKVQEPMEEATASASSAAPLREIVDPAPSVESGVELITDEELFALFPNRSLALIGEPGRQELIVLDEATGVGKK